MEYELLNPTTQVSLFTVCIGNCTSLLNITWNIYHGVLNSSSKAVQWTRFQPMISYENVLFFGKYISMNSRIINWLFQV